MGYALRNVMIGEMYRSDLKEGDSMKRNNFIDTLKGIFALFLWSLPIFHGAMKKDFIFCSRFGLIWQFLFL